MDPLAVATEVYALWSVQDVESTFAHVAEDAVYALHFDEDLAPFAGISEGREAMMAAFYAMIEEFDYLKYEPTILGVEGEIVRVQIQFRFHHRRTGETLEGSMRSVMTVTDGLIVRCEEYLDRGHVEAFMRLIRQREADNEIVLPPDIPKRPSQTEMEPPRRATTKVPDEEGCG